MRSLTEQEVQGDYEKETGNVIVDGFKDEDLDPVAIPGCLVRNHGVFSWGHNPNAAAYHAVVMEECAKTALHTQQINPDVKPSPQFLVDKHYLRKHGKNAYYGQC